MKLVRYGRAGAERPGLIDAAGRLRDLSRVVADITPVALSPAGLKRLRAVKPERLPLVKGKPRLGCPLASIGKIVCIGLNYTDHAQEVSLPLPKEPTIFIKASSAIRGPDDAIARPPGAVKLDYEVALAAVIGRAARSVDEPQALALWTTVNGERRQHGSTRDMVFPVRQLVAYLSRFMTLLPGDLVSTGTPAGEIGRHTSELQSQSNLVCRLLLEKKKNKDKKLITSKQKKQKSQTNMNMH